MSNAAWSSDVVRPRRRGVTAATPENAEEAADKLDGAVQRAERLIGRLDSQLAEAEVRLKDAARVAERSMAVADELRQDVSSLIVALQGLATEVDAQIRDHTAALMAAISTADEHVELARTAKVPVEGLSEEVSALIEELRATAEVISADLERRSDELRQLIDTAARTTAEPAPRRSGSPARPALVGATAEAPKWALPLSPQEEGLPSIMGRASAVRDEVRVTRELRATESGRYSQAMELAGQGLGADEIARLCGLGREEVRLFLRLHNSGIRE